MALRVLPEFKSFLLKQNAIALAVGVVIGGAVGRVVTGIVEDLVMPVVGVLLPAGDWRSAQLVIWRENAIKYGDLAGRVVDFLIIAGAVFALTRLVQPALKGPATRECKECLEAIPAAARRCRACGSLQT